jgi:hypothetical protein
MTSALRLGRICLALAIVAAGVPVAPAAGQAASGRATLKAHAGTIVGSVLDSGEKPVPSQRLRLRDVSTGRIQAVARADMEGIFRFDGVPGGTYFVEAVDAEGGVLAVSRAFGLSAGERVSTTVMLPGRARWLVDLFDNTGLAVVAAAAGLGISAVGTGFQPASGRF